MFGEKTLLFFYRRYLWISDKQVLPLSKHPEVFNIFLMNALISITGCVSHGHYLRTLVL